MAAYPRHVYGFRLIALLAAMAGVPGLAACGTDGPPGATPAPRAASWRGFAAGQWPGAGWRPYAPSSAFNRAVTAADAVNPRSRRMVDRVLSWGLPSDITAGLTDTAGDFDHPVYFARTTDPLVRLRATRPWGRNPLTGRRIRVPAGARPAAGDDAHMAIVQPDGWEYDLWGVRHAPRSGVALRFAWGGRLRIDGSGVGGAATAADFGALAGIVRPEELAAGRIDHALFIVLRCTSNTSAFGAGARAARPEDRGSAFVHPARKGGRRCTSRDADAPPMGARFQLAMTDAEIGALGLPRWKRAIVTALARYGGYVGDTGGAGFGIVMLSGSTYTSFGESDRLVDVARRAGIRAQGSEYRFDLASGIDWGKRLRVLMPPR
jgi:hypothetical protein